MKLKKKIIDPVSELKLFGSTIPLKKLFNTSVYCIIIFYSGLINSSKKILQNDEQLQNAAVKNRFKKKGWVKKRNMLLGLKNSVNKIQSLFYSWLPLFYVSHFSIIIHLRTLKSSLRQTSKAAALMAAQQQQAAAAAAAAAQAQPSATQVAGGELDDMSGDIQVDEWNADPNEPRYCLCNQVSYGEMVGCDNNDVSVIFFLFQSSYLPMLYSYSIKLCV